jgi:hypothetical protein
VAADAQAPQAVYRVLRGIVHHPGGVAREGDLIPLDPADGDPLCEGPNAVLAREGDPVPAIDADAPKRITAVIEYPAGEGDDWQTGERPDDAPIGKQIGSQGLEPIAPAPKRTRKA